MAHTFSSVLVHIVFSTKGRLNLITPDEMHGRLHRYLAGILTQRELGCAIGIGGTANHVHARVDISMKHGVAEIVKQMKITSTVWVNETFHLPAKFAWQIGYGAFAVSASSRKAVVAYIANQERHHRRQTFEEEYLQLLTKHGIDYDERFVLD